MDGGIEAGRPGPDEPASPPTTPAARPRRIRRWVRRHRILTASALGVLLVVLVSAGSFAWIRISTASAVHTVAVAPPAPVALVLGAGLRSDGSPSPYLQARLEDARALYAAGTVKAILVSGDNSTVDHDEATAMQRWLVEHGVPTRQVVRDHAGFDTYDSCVRARKIFGVTKAIVVTQGFHLPRALFLCRHAGIDVVGVASGAVGGRGLEYTAREVPASVKAVWDAITAPDPHFLGRYEPALDLAVASR